MWEPIINTHIPGILSEKTDNTAQILTILNTFQSNYIAKIPALKARALAGATNLFTKHNA